MNRNSCVSNVNRILSQLMIINGQDAKTKGAEVPRSEGEL